MNRREALKGVVAISVASLAPFDAQSLETTVEVHRKLDDGWHHYAVSRYKGETRYFVDGREVGREGPNIASFTGSSATWEQHWGILDDMAKAMPDGDYAVSGNACGEWLDELICEPL
jgi:hypothetical protein